MTKRSWTALACAVCAPLLTQQMLAQQNPPVYFSVPPVDAPELAHRGVYSVGVRTVDIVHPNQPDILHFNKETGKAPLYDRPLKLEIWYPATIPAGQQEQTVYVSPMAGRPERQVQGAPKTFEIAGKALRDAPPVAGQKFPVVIVSHGYPGSRTFLSYLSENLASKGYVVAAIDHTDSVFGGVQPFASTLLNRASDQLFTIEALAGLAAKPDHFLHGLADAGNAAIIGYSMGGYGVLASAGAGYSKNSAAAKLVPGGYFDDWTAGNEKFAALQRGSLKAIVAMAPWGDQEPYRSWDDASLANIRIPTLFIVGDQDDVSGYESGVKRLFQAAVNSERCLLVYENARHNVGGNPAPPEAMLNFTSEQSFEEPVWRKDRITAINQHFVTAFLDLYLKGDQSKREYLHVPVARSNDGKWPVEPGAPETGEYSPGTGPKTVWKGFQRRWALGMEMYCSEGGQAAK